ncbi:hypothetical protein BLA29_012667 [Euroglyphus maynei]|uniref:Uncharacterized protein n=1 Tax=Euroglyphus maynei TaxID=6958 RepID=A0A1Y3B640_EURMA|nr:hypothetical protein BLA29_012667 [Euroglyphus maynei]
MILWILVMIHCWKQMNQ